MSNMESKDDFMSKTYEDIKILWDKYKQDFPILVEKAPDAIYRHAFIEGMLYYAKLENSIRKSMQENKPC